MIPFPMFWLPFLPGKKNGIALLGHDVYWSCFRSQSALILSMMAQTTL